MFFRRIKRENKAKLEHKLYLAKETPEPEFDLSECDIKEVPQGIYSLCRVFLKNTLRLEHNNLNSLSGGGNLIDLRLLKILNISHNDFTNLPEQIDALESLQELHASHNSLKTLPNTLCNLKNLKLLDVSHNHLKHLPEDIGNIISLKNLDLSHNNCLKHLPTSICQAHNLTHLLINSAHFEYPPQEVVERGLEALMQYICDDVGLEFKKPESLTDILQNVDRSDCTIEEDDKLKAKIWELETIKQNRTRQFLEIEKNNELLQRQELDLAYAQKLNREKLLKDIAHEQDEFDSRLLQLQHEKEQDRFRLIEQLHETEQNAYAAIEQLLAINREPQDSLLEFERKEKEKLIAAANSHNDYVKKSEILEAMQNILHQEISQFEQMNQQRIEVTNSILQREIEWENKISELLHIHNTSKKDVVSKLLSDMDLQKAALGALLERNDARSWGLIQQVSLVESQLAALTQIELDRRKLQLDEQVNIFAEKRLELSMLLMDLLEQQDMRRSEILDTLKTLEDNWDKQSQDYWLKQYQALLNRIPEGLNSAQKNINPLLGEALLMNGVIHCLPHLAKIMQTDIKLESVGENELIDAGVSSKQDRLKILDAFKFFKKQRNTIEMQSKSELEGIDKDEACGTTKEPPSAPPLDHLKYVGGSMTECVVCMDEECQVIFVPCGHIVCCLQCSTTINQCPLCRADIERKIKILLQ